MRNELTMCLAREAIARTLPAVVNDCPSDLRVLIPADDNASLEVRYVLLERNDGKLFWITQPVTEEGYRRMKDACPPGFKAVHSIHGVIRVPEISDEQRDDIDYLSLDEIAAGLTIDVFMATLKEIREKAKASGQ